MRRYSNTVMPVSAKRSVLAPPDSSSSRSDSVYTGARRPSRCASSVPGNRAGSARFQPGATGKPALLDQQGDPHVLRFNLSHSHGRMLVAIANGQNVGIDLEQVRGNLEPPACRTVLHSDGIRNDQDSARRRACLSILSSMGGQRSLAQGARNRNKRFSNARFLCPTLRHERVSGYQAIRRCKRAGRMVDMWARLARSGVCVRQ